MLSLPWKEKRSTRKRPQARRRQPAAPLFEWRPPRWLMYGLAVVLLLGGLLAWLPKEQWLPIESIRLVGRFDQVDPSGLQKQLQGYLGQGFFTVDIKGLQQKVDRLPWVRESRVQRIWPNRLQLRVIEREAVARFDVKHLIDRDGELFEADAGNFPDLPLIKGYAGESRDLLRRYARANPRFSELGLRVIAWLEDEKGSLSLRFDKGLELRIGSEDREQKIERFLAIYPAYLKPQIDRMAVIDFRYSNGFAVAWKKPGDRPSQGRNVSKQRRDKRNV